MKAEMTKSEITRACDGPMRSDTFCPIVGHSLMLSRGLIEEGKQVADVVFRESRPSNSQITRFKLHPLAVTPQCNCKVDRIVSSSVERRSAPGSVGIFAMTTAATAPLEHACSDMRRAAGLGIAEAVEKSKNVSHFLR